MQTPIAALEAALTNTDQPDTRKTYGKVEFVLIPVTVVEAVLADAAVSEDTAEAPEPDITAAEVAVVVEPVDPLAAFVAPTTEIAGPLPDSFPDDEADGEVVDVEDPDVLAAQEEE